LKSFAELSEQEVLALAISNEDEDNRIYRSFADALRESYPDTAEMYDKMAQEEIGHSSGDRMSKALWRGVRSG